MRVPIIFATLTLFAVSIVLYFGGAMPMLQVAGDYTRIVTSGAASLAAVTTLAALIILWRRTRGSTARHLWLAVSLAALLLDLLLTMYSSSLLHVGLAPRPHLRAARRQLRVPCDDGRGGRLSRSIVDAERKLHVFFDSVADAILTIDARDVIASCNHAVAMLFDISEDRLTRMPVTRIIPD